jgi:two-component system cell cycle sensor histidine kinase/response regulator CckA
MPPSRSKGAREEEAAEALIQVIRLATPKADSHDLIRSILEHTRNWLGCQAAGIRLRDGEDYPYFEVQGFPAEFVRLENSLCAAGPDGAALHDPTGGLIPDCVCGDVILGRFDPEKPFFTTGGSFWTNSMTDLLASPTEAKRLVLARDRCDGEGYESVALVPLRPGGEAGETVGLLQLGDKRRNRFTLETIARVEKVASGIAVALAERKAREGLRAMEDKHRMLFEQALDGVVIATSDGTILEANPAACAMFGVTENEILRSRLEDLVVADQAFSEHLVERDRTGRTTGEMTFVCKDGAHFSVEFTSSLLLSADGSRRALLAFRDITERKRVEESLRESEAKTRGILDSIRMGVGLLSPKMEILDLNPLMREWFPGVDVERRPLCYHVLNDPPRETVCDDCPTCKALQDGLAHEATRQKPTAHGVRSYRVVSSPIFDESGEVTALIELVEDVTERLALELQFLQAQKMESVGRLAGGVAHDFNNMLGVILGHTEMALEQTGPGQLLHADLTEIRKAAERSADLTRQLLAFARKQTVAPRVLDLNEVVSGMLNMLERLIGEYVHLDWQPAADLWATKVDPSQVGQILTNLCVNARDAITGVGRVAIATRNRAPNPAYCSGHPGATPGEYVQLAVSDDGCGMDRETIGRLFEPFFTTKGVGEGTGLGLATVYGIVKQNSGFITVESKPGEGSTFAIHLPRYVAATEVLEREGGPAPPARGRETILLVEDEPAILKLTARMLESRGYTVVVAGGPGEAIRLARERPGEIHLLVTDVVMPEMNGRDLAKNLLSLYPRIKRLFMSGYTSDVIAHQGVLDEGVHFIQKPFTAPELAAQVRLALTGEANEA